MRLHGDHYICATYNGHVYIYITQLHIHYYAIVNYIYQNIDIKITILKLRLLLCTTDFSTC